jgi:TolB-like protein/DNA-binding winged helix-turn-helix (wHTH) protein/Flp pilus assembly protein TadD
MTIAAPSSRDRLRFGDFVLDLAAFELRHEGRIVRLERQPMDLLILLATRRGELVSRAEIAEALWAPGVFVDIDTGVHTAIRKIRRALRDSPETPTFVETVPARGYRFIAPISVEGPASTPARAPEVTVHRAPVAEALTNEAPARGARPASGARYAIAALVLAVLAGLVAWAWRRGDAPPAEVTLAVLPFDNLSGDPEAEYLANGLAEEVMVALGQVDPDRLHVVGRGSIMRYANTTRSHAEIGRELGAQYLVESAVRVEGGRVRITAALVRTENQLQIWAASFDREPTSILNLQQELSSAIASQVRLRLSPDRVTALARRQTRNAEAYDFYLRGRNFLLQRTPATTRRAVDYFKQATTVDPSYALAWAGMAQAYGGSMINSDANPLEVGPLARDAALQSVNADPSLAEAQLALGYTQWTYGWNWVDAERAVRRAAALDPQSVQVHVVLGHVLSQMGRHDEAERFMRRARELDPLYALGYALSSQTAYQARDYASAMEYARQAIVIDPDFWIGHIMRGQAADGLGQLDQALEALTLAARFSGQNSKALAMRGYALARAGRTAEARDLLATLETVSHQRYVPPYAFALVHAGLGERDAVFEWLDKAYTAHDVHLMYLVDARWDPYRDDARFKALIDRCGFMRTARN